MISKSKAKKEMFVSCDLGYGAIKANFDGVKVKQDSVYVPIYENPSWEDGIDLEDPDAVDEAIKNLLNKLDVSINDTRYLVGKSALDKLGQTITMQMDAPNGKANSNSAIILPDAFIAGRAIQEAYENSSDEFVIGEPIQVNVQMVTALPISEARNENGEDVRPEYADRFTKKVHTVTVHSLGEDIVVRIKYDNILVLKEGQIATNSAIQHGDATLAKKLIAQLKKDYPDRADEAEDLILKATDYISIDIGQGTTDMALFYEGAVNDNSYSINQGFGNIIEDVFKRFRDPLVKTREDFVRVWHGEAGLRDLQTKIDNQIKHESNVLQADILTGLTSLLRKNPATKVIYVFGGGSIPMMERYDLGKKIKDRIKLLRTPAVLVWVGRDYAQDLNEIALDNIVSYLKEQAK